jgi:hypothetical protein
MRGVRHARRTAGDDRRGRGRHGGRPEAEAGGQLVAVVDGAEKDPSDEFTLASGDDVAISITGQKLRKTKVDTRILYFRFHLSNRCAGFPWAENIDLSIN